MGLGLGGGQTLPQLFPSSSQQEGRGQSKVKPCRSVETRKNVNLWGERGAERRGESKPSQIHSGRGPESWEKLAALCERRGQGVLLRKEE